VLYLRTAGGVGEESINWSERSVYASGIMKSSKDKFINNTLSIMNGPEAIIGSSEVRVLPMRRCRRAALQT
jgi:hypothetical protein